MHPSANPMLMAPGYQKPSLLTQGTPVGTITSNGLGYLISAFNVASSYCYLNKSLTTGKWYWEAVGNWATAGNSSGIGVALPEDLASALSYGGYTESRNGGVLGGGFFGPAPWRSAFNFFTGAVDPWSGGLWADNDTLGLALDLDSATKTLNVYQNNVLKGGFTFAGMPSSIRPGMVATQGTVQLRLGPYSCIYAPPSGYIHT